jgi:hypothetical protein
VVERKWSSSSWDKSNGSVTGKVVSLRFVNSRLLDKVKTKHSVSPISFHVSLPSVLFHPPTLHFRSEGKCEESQKLEEGRN